MVCYVEYISLLGVVYCAWYAMLNTSHCWVLFIVCYVEYITLLGVVYCVWYAMLNTSHCWVLFIVRGMLC